MKKFLMYLVCSIILLPPAAPAADFRFSPKPNKAHLIQWRPWSAAALAEAQQAKKLILLSISAVWCHWCHVMDETTYSDDEVIKLINERFIPIRVDADLRPDIDGLYNQGGWPSTVILMPSGEILDAGNYIRAQELAARLLFAVEQFERDPEGLIERVRRFWLSRDHDAAGIKSLPDREDIKRIVALALESFDPVYGGFGSGQKFPPIETLDFLLAAVSRTDAAEIRNVITVTLDNMANGGLLDRIEGGFFRYSVTPDWSGPHYEKMLDVNAGLIRNYADAYRLLGRKKDLHVAELAVRYVLKNLADERTGAFFGSQDADEEYYRLADRTGATIPLVDRTSYADSSSLMISAVVAVADASKNRDALIRRAERAAAFLLKRHYSPQEGVYHAFREGASSLPGMLSDHALMGSALLDLYTATGKRRYLDRSRALGRMLVDRFYDEQTRRFRSWVARTDVPPAGDGMLGDRNMQYANYRALRLLARLSHYPGADRRVDTIIPAVLITFSNQHATYSHEAAAFGNVLRWARGEPIEITIISAQVAPRAYLDAVAPVYAPEKVVRVLSPGRDAKEIKRLGYPLREAVYVCAGKRCSKPIKEPKRLGDELKRFMAGGERR